MAKSFPVGFRIHIPEPIEVKMVSPTLAIRDSIHEFERYPGLFTYVVEDDTFYYLSEGIENSNWKSIGKSDVNAIEILDVFIDQPQKVISGFGIKKYLEDNYITKEKLDNAIDFVNVPNYIRNITEQQIQKWDSLVSDKHKIHIQNTPSMTWVVNHQLNKKPSVQSFLNDDTKIEGCIEHIDNKILTIKFSKALIGYVTLN